MKNFKRLVAITLAALFLGTFAVPPANAATYYYFSRSVPIGTTVKASDCPTAKTPAGSTVKTPTGPTVKTPTGPIVRTPGTTKPATPASPAPATGNVSAPLSADEQTMVNLVNRERTSRGLAPLQVDMRLVKVARMKSLDMIKNNYFSHQSPTYGSPFDLMRSQGITYRAAGENLAGASSVTQAHTNLMNSSGHRANILNANYNRIGIGIVKGGPYGMMISQEFIGI
ncbi:MAG TPA: CAP domain-containing protein [Methylomusa anaerophila]|uniref:Cysteine-rich secretory protein family protein n=1 Tax=Methylomusa anaerophila TaxID=1930071 RepID=A0A348AM81_9FIRM|nr:CAP domain-containing protein [Methylomusa anaerophila]BBB92179.1 cysteine-rich secretory protein family protein [Methylomusa anaerophila]HML87807.1 CAP domain-containing protein [Methylomusa anaerophila]